MALFIIFIGTMVSFFMVNITSSSRRISRLQENMRTRYESRIYRRTCRAYDLVSFSVIIRETDLFILAEKNLQEQARKAALEGRRILEQYIARNPLFLKSLVPLSDDAKAPPLVSSMILAARKAKVGPMAAVAGAIAEFVGRELLNHSSQVVVENGGDIFLQSSQTRTILILAGKSAFSGRIALEIEAEQSPLGICTSSGTCGHSLSFGRADAAVILSPSAALADAAATAMGNIIQTRDDIDKALKQVQAMEGIDGAVLLKDDSAGFWGKVKITGAHHLRDSL